ncbi:hypothetical protein [Stakelama tenebrarum]|uniref:Uncharacterized protein n=1 Tax=Stakelama tenebrarum TaxID=2711215 RepID=A0A6G6Y1Z4_9SPHN|nr:hypothetical protein [Sphingosinithalassobacter tenebrarum]QIG78945.1 hypothetical protein G5C33_03520 [Sphingosinithalassobacter tenebrarum]
MAVGPRGWTVGPFLCLWLSAFDRHGPILIGMIRRDRETVRVVGRAGSDLNGMIAFILLIPVMAWTVTMAHRSGQYFTPLGYLTIFLLFGAGLPWMLWYHHRHRKDAAPLVRFVQDAITDSSAKLRRMMSSTAFDESLRLDIGGVAHGGPCNGEDVYNGLLRGDFVILSRDDDHFFQTIPHGGGYRVEMREGREAPLLRAWRADSPGAAGEIFALAHTLDAMVAYGSGRPLPEFLVWKEIAI